MILNFIPGLKADRSAAADEFYLMLSVDNVPEKELTKSEFLKTIKNINFKNKAEATNFISIRRTGDRIVITFSKDQVIKEQVKYTPPAVIQQEDDVVFGKTVGWFLRNGERIEGIIVRQTISHGKTYYQINYKGQIKFKIKDQVNILK